MAKKSAATMIDIPAQLGIVQKKRKYRLPVKTVRIPICIALVIIGICGIIYMLKYAPVEQVDGQQDIDIESAVKQYMVYGKPAAVLELEYTGGFLKNYSYSVVLNGGIRQINRTTQCEDFILRSVWYLRSGENNFIRSEEQMGKILLENDFTAGFEIGRCYLLVIYEREEYLSDFYEIESPRDSLKRESCVYVPQPKQEFIECLKEGYLLPDGSIVTKENFKNSMVKVLRILQ